MISRILSLGVLIIISNLSFCQEVEVDTTAYTFKGPCCDSNGNPTNPGDFSNQVYSVKRFRRKTLIDLNIKTIMLGKETINLDLNHRKKIKGETGIINLNETLGVKLVVGKTIENNIKKYVYKLMVFKKDSESNCWRPFTTMQSMFDVYNQTLLLNGYTIGTPGTKDYFQIVDGWIKFN